MWRHNGFASNRAPYILVKKPGRKKGEPTHASKLIHNERFSGPASCSDSYKTCDSMVLYLKRGSILIFSSKFWCQPKMEFWQIDMSSSVMTAKALAPPNTLQFIWHLLSWFPHTAISWNALVAPPALYTTNPLQMWTVFHKGQFLSHY